MGSDAATPQKIKLVAPSIHPSIHQIHYFDVSQYHDLQSINNLPSHRIASHRMMVLVCMLYRRARYACMYDGAIASIFLVLFYVISMHGSFPFRYSCVGQSSPWCTALPHQHHHPIRRYQDVIIYPITDIRNISFCSYNRRRWRRWCISLSTGDMPLMIDGGGGVANESINYECTVMMTLSQEMIEKDKWDTIHPPENEIIHTQYLQ